jgi:5-methylcytosine-specific restriction protein A
MRPPVHGAATVGARPQRREWDRPRLSAWKRGYDDTWRKLRIMHLAREPLCRFCAEKGIVEPAEVVDHIETIEARPDLRLDDRNLRSLCVACHNRRTAEDQAARSRAT